MLPAHSKSAKPFKRFLAAKSSFASSENPSSAFAVMSSKTVPSSMKAEASKPEKSIPIFPPPDFEKVPSILSISGRPLASASAL